MNLVRINTITQITQCYTIFLIWKSCHNSGQNYKLGQNYADLISGFTEGNYIRIDRRKPDSFRCKSESDKSGLKPNIEGQFQTLPP